jgi:hypothetical protein
MLLAENYIMCALSSAHHQGSLTSASLGNTKVLYEPLYAGPAARENLKPQDSGWPICSMAYSFPNGAGRKPIV